MGNEPAVDHDFLTVTENQYIKELETHLKEMTLLNISYLKKIKILEEQIHSYDLQRTSAGSPADPFFDKSNNQSNLMGKPLNSDLHALKDSYSFRVGETIANGFRKPGMNTVFMPFRLTRLMIEYIFRRR